MTNSEASLLGVLILVAAAIVLVHAGDIGRPEIPYPCEDPEAFPFCDTNLPVSDRVHDLVSRFTLAEKAQLLGNNGVNISRLGLPPYQWWQEGLHGVGSSPGVDFDGRVKAATSFPQPILTAASFNRKLFNNIAQVISTEARAMHNENQAGLSYWSPNINIFRDPRWGRGQETPGEDPYLTGIYSEYFVRGLQEDEEYAGQSVGSTGKGPEKLKTSACCKHFTAYDIDQWYNVDRYDFDAKVTEQDLLDTYNPPFQRCVVQGKSSSLMCSYNEVNEVPTCADYNFLTKLVRGDWGFDGYIVSDCDALQVMYANTKYAQTPDDAIAYSLEAGLDINCGDTATNFTEHAVNNGVINVTDIDRALHNSFTVLFRLGFFDGNPHNDAKYGKLDKDYVCTQEHQDLALEAALQGIVLLKNDDHTLPFSSEKIRSLAVLGPNANDTISTMLGNYAGLPCEYITPYAGLSNYVQVTAYHPGCNSTACEDNAYIRPAARMASQTDAVVLVVGLGQDQEREAFDRTSLRLPGMQEELIKVVSKVAKGPVILVLMTGGPVDISVFKEDPKIKSILWVGYPGQAGGKALAQIVFGERNPGGKLPMSWYPESYTKIPMTDMHMRPDPVRDYPGRTYRFYTGEMAYTFGDGMSYTTFVSKFLKAPTSVIAPADSNRACSERGTVPTSTPCWAEGDASLSCDSMKMNITVGVKNEGPYPGTEIVMLFHMSPVAGLEGNPGQNLVGFERVDLGVNEEQKVVFEVDMCDQLRAANTDGTWSDLNEGLHTFLLGNRKETEVKHYMQLMYRND